MQLPEEQQTLAIEARKQSAWSAMLSNFQHLKTDAQVGFLVKHTMIDGVELPLRKGAAKRQENTRALRAWFELNWDKVVVTE
jgi:hypothetical protein